jgi:hypothetical protein
VFISIYTTYASKIAGYLITTHCGWRVWAFWMVHLFDNLEIPAIKIDHTKWWVRKKLTPLSSTSSNWSLEMPIAIQWCDIMPLLYHITTPSSHQTKLNVKPQEKGWAE